ncbi:MAG TPA: YciI family protein [Gammaproteobacteria bacterium]|nr:YciI family protein [Gammaproteobacteria bacterium]
MFVILVTYKKPLETVDKHLVDHADFLEKGYEKNYFIVSGRKNPRTGGIIISQLKDRNQLENILKNDPFYIHEIADYEIIEFIPGKYHPDFSAFIAS